MSHGQRGCTAIFGMFAFSFFKPQTAWDWRSFRALSAFIVALFVEMYGFPLTLYLLSGWLQARYPMVNLLSHEARHLWWTLTGQQGHFGAGWHAYAAATPRFLPRWRRCPSA